jgi:hypothetical protein
VRIGPCHDHELLVGASVGRRLDAVAHLGALDECLAGPVAATLHGDLVFEMTGARAGGDQLPDRPPDHEGATPAGVGVDKQRQLGGSGNATHVVADVVERCHRKIGQAEGCVRDARA